LHGETLEVFGIMAKMILNESRLYFQEFGSSQPLILIAGLASDSQSWLPVIVKLSKYFRVIIFDNRGVGRSPQDNDGITIQQMTDDCVKLMEHLNLSSVYVLGHSMGGMIAMDLSIRYPELIDKLILEAITPKLNNRNKELFADWVSYLKSGMDKSLWYRNMFYWIFSPKFFEDTVILDQAVKMSINYPYPQSDKSFENQVNAASVFNCVSEIYKIQSPTLIMNGEQDLLFSSSDASELFKDIDHLQYVTIPNAAHSIHMDNPDGFTDAVVDFLL